MKIEERYKKYDKEYLEMKKEDFEDAVKLLERELKTIGIDPDKVK